MTSTRGLGIAEPGCIFDQRVQNRLQIKSRAAYDFQHFARRSLLLQGLGEIAVANLQFLKQPDVFDRDHGLVGECFKKSDLLVGERIDCGTTNKNRSNRNTFPHQWHSKLGSITYSFNAGLEDLRKLSRGYRQQILNMDWLTVDNGSASYGTTVNR